MSTRFKILVIRLLVAIHKHQLATLRVCADERKQVIIDAEQFIEDIYEKEGVIRQ